MIPQQTFETYPVFSDSGTKVQPDNAKYSAGFQQSDVLPAEWVNWFWNKSSKGVTDLNQGLLSVEKELIAVLTEYGITPAEATEDQLKQALVKMRNKVTSCDTAASTAAKSIAVTGEVLKAGNIYAITMTNANTAANPTLSVNSGTAYPMCDASGTALKAYSWAAGDIVTVLFTGAKFIMATATADKIENNNLKAVTSNAVSVISASSTTITGPALGTGGNIRVMFTADITGADSSSALSLSYNTTSYSVKVCKDGALANFTAKEITSAW